MKLFNVDATRLAGTETDAPDLELQNALARLGAVHLIESQDVLPSDRLADANAAVRETLITGTPRLVTALGPVLVVQIDRVNLHKIDATLADLGLGRRLRWLVDNVRAAIDLELPDADATWSRRYRRATVVLNAFMDGIAAPASPPLDIFDRTVRSAQTLAQLQRDGSPISRRWGIVTSLSPTDFAHTLKAARADHR